MNTSLVSAAFAKFDAAYCTMLEAAADVRRAVAAEAGVRAGSPCAEIIAVVARFYGHAPEDILSKSRKRDVVQARHVAMWLSRALTTFSLQAIGNAFGGLDHGTVMWAIETVGNRSSIEPRFASELLDLRRRCEAALNASTALDPQPAAIRSA